MRDGEDYYFGGKGGKGTVSHGNLDAGSFIWELNGVRWSIDPGNQNYNELEQAGFDLWGSCQDCERWNLLTKNNYGHSTLTVNEELHVNDGFAKMLEVKKGDQPEASFDLTPVFGNKLKKATRKFIKPDNNSIVIEDHIETNVHTKMITWQMMTQADVSIVDGGAVLSQDGKKIMVENLSHPEIMVSVISLDPAPLELDRQIEGLKRLEIRIPAYLIENNADVIKIKLKAL